ncbi:MAG TPA: hypothetical protein VFJ58_20255 [Armatimonadota bacterium]|nr:hypothetical protein [Armatimonadota bacterium]
MNVKAVSAAWGRFRLSPVGPAGAMDVPLPGDFGRRGAASGAERSGPVRPSSPGTRVTVAEAN